MTPVIFSVQFLRMLLFPDEEGNLNSVTDSLRPKFQLFPRELKTCSF